MTTNIYDTKKPLTSELKNVLTPFVGDDVTRSIFNTLKVYVTATFDSDKYYNSEKISKFDIKANYQAKNFVHSNERDLFLISSGARTQNVDWLHPDWEKLYERGLQPEYICLNFERTALWRFLLMLTDPELKTMFSYCLIRHGFDKIIARSESERNALLKIVDPDIQIIW